LIEIPAVPNEIDLSKNGLACILLDSKYNRLNPIFNELHQYDPELNQKSLIKHADQATDVIQMLLNYEL